MNRVRAAHGADADAAMTVARAPKTAAWKPKQALHPMQRALRKPQSAPPRAKKAVNRANVVRVTAMAVTAASEVAVASGVSARMRHRKLERPKTRKFKKSSTWYALPTLPSPQRHRS